MGTMDCADCNRLLITNITMLTMLAMACKKITVLCSVLSAAIVALTTDHGYATAKWRAEGSAWILHNCGDGNTDNAGDDCHPVCQ